MNADPRAALANLTASLERHLEASASRRGENDPTVVAAYQAVADAFDLYDDALLEAYGEVTPLEIYSGDDGDDDDDDDDGDEVLDDHGDEDGDSNGATTTMTTMTATRCWTTMATRTATAMVSIWGLTTATTTKSPLALSDSFPGAVA